MGGSRPKLRSLCPGSSFSWRGARLTVIDRPRVTGGWAMLWCRDARTGDKCMVTAAADARADAG